MYNKSDLINHIQSMGIKHDDTLLVHSSMKAVGETENGADTVLDAFIEYLADGLLIFPTHTWDRMNEDHLVFDPLADPSCVGILSNLFLKRPGVIRSWHPTHSVAALGRNAETYVSGEERFDTPCARGSCWGKLYDRGAKILFLGCSLKTNTILHGVEEWNNIPDRLSEDLLPFKIRTPSGSLIERPMRRHYNAVGDVSRNYDKMETPIVHTGAAVKGRIGDARSFLCDVVKMVDLVSSLLARNPDLFLDDSPVPPAWYIHP